MSFISGYLKYDLHSCIINFEFRKIFVLGLCLARPCLQRTKSVCKNHTREKSHETSFHDCFVKKRTNMSFLTIPRNFNKHLSCCQKCSIYHAFILSLLTHYYISAGNDTVCALNSCQWMKSLLVIDSLVLFSLSTFYLLILNWIMPNANPQNTVSQLASVRRHHHTAIEQLHELPTTNSGKWNYSVIILKYVGH